MATTRFRLMFHVPSSAASACKTAIFAAGAGRQGNYRECCFTTTAGTGQFRPSEGANPAIGKVGALEEVEEVCVETLCVGEETTRKVVAALKSAHPYEEPSYSVFKLEDF
ncbi:GTP cyclohydrolase 1 type 2/Nif3 [Astrocystis sublimbata]|nr:GTP cyclohydrolase 1 type 2/Nif3 [Astrocystis sublimbata]